ncbi:acyl-CoA dehydrogenase [Nocardia panacis]|uniref:Acyl-CoA dehydrogenase n=1 Tax=Nocardia panacis TaxID=2340916 RepID=A0A3A4K3M9_9NOCA|nr:acyl-CoA dehydrogenase [Nocardia panacis]RJO71243.1 acyl-CoA dehydrogenase [Nocardia panacis]
MTIATTDEHKAVQESMRGWAASVRPIATMRERSGDFWRLFWPGLTELGIFRVAVDEVAGGAGGTVGDLAVLVEQAAHDLVGGPILTTAVAGLVTGGALAEKQPCGIGLDGIFNACAESDDAVGAVPFSGSVPPAVSGIDSASNGVLLDGVWESVLGADADTAVLLPARTPKGLRWCLIEPGAAGVRVEALAPVDLSVPLARVHCTAVSVPDARIFGSPVAVGDLVVALAAAELAGVAGWCLRTAVDYAKVREQFGRKIGGFQAVKHLCAWMLCRTEMIRSVAADVAAAVDESLVRAGGRPEEVDSREAMAGPEAVDNPGAVDNSTVSVENSAFTVDNRSELPIAAAIAAATALDAAVDTAKDCIQVLGGIGFTWEHDAHLYLRRAIALRQLLGGGARWRARVTELTRAGARRTTGAERVLAAEDVVAVSDSWLDKLRAELAQIAALPEPRRRAALVDAGLVMPHWPQPYGRGANSTAGLVISEELRRAGIAAPDLVIGGWAVPTLLRHGTPEQIERFALPTLRGEIIWCQLFSEPEAGSDLAALRTTAKRVDGGWLLNGQKIWTSEASKADWGICLARTDAAAPKHRGISYFLVDMRSAGFDLRPLVQITGLARFSEVFLDDVFVPDDGLVGALHDGWRIARATLSHERIAMSGNGIGDELQTLIDSLPASGPGAELREDRLGGFIAEAVAGLLLEQRAAVRTLAGGDAGAQSSVRKLVGVRHRQAVAEFAAETMGPAGAQDNPAVTEFLQTRCLSIAGGTEQILLTVAGERILGLPRDDG